VICYVVFTSMFYLLTSPKWRRLAFDSLLFPNVNTIVSVASTTHVERINSARGHGPFSSSAKQCLCFCSLVHQDTPMHAAHRII
jgi:hypothetical protein